jgi:hypothetical protein
MRLQNASIETATGGMGEKVNYPPFAQSPFPRFLTIFLLAKGMIINLC